MEGGREGRRAGRAGLQRLRVAGGGLPPTGQLPAGPHALAPLPSRPPPTRRERQRRLQAHGRAGRGDQLPIHARGATPAWAVGVGVVWARLGGSTARAAAGVPRGQRTRPRRAAAPANTPSPPSSPHPPPHARTRRTPQVWGYFSVKAGGAIHEYSDSQFGHLFAKGETREAAIRAMVVALKEVKIRRVDRAGGWMGRRACSRPLPTAPRAASAQLGSCRLHLPLIPLPRAALLPSLPQGRDPHQRGLRDRPDPGPRVCEQPAPHRLAGRAHRGADPLGAPALAPLRRLRDGAEVRVAGGARQHFACAAPTNPARSRLPTNQPCSRPSTPPPPHPRALDRINSRSAEYLSYLQKGQLPPARISLVALVEEFVVDGARRLPPPLRCMGGAALLACPLPLVGTAARLGRARPPRPRPRLRPMQV